jgi:hypothetical protein
MPSACKSFGNSSEASGPCRTSSSSSLGETRKSVAIRSNLTDPYGPVHSTHAGVSANWRRYRSTFAPQDKACFQPSSHTPAQLDLLYPSTGKPDGCCAGSIQCTDFLLANLRGPLRGDDAKTKIQSAKLGARYRFILSSRAQPFPNLSTAQANMLPGAGGCLARPFGDRCSPMTPGSATSFEKSDRSKNRLGSECTA